MLRVPDQPRNLQHNGGCMHIPRVGSAQRAVGKAVKNKSTYITVACDCAFWYLPHFVVYCLVEVEVVRD